MSEHSKIEWTDSTWNPVTGCTKVSAGCKNCYAERLAPKVFAGQTVPVKLLQEKHPIERPRRFEDVRCHPERLEQPLHWRKPRRIFVNSLSDLFHEDVPHEFIEKVIGVMALAGQHTFQILTKRPKRMLEYMSTFSHGGCVAAVCDGSLAFRSPKGRRDRLEHMPRGWPWPLPNVWLGISCEDQKTFDERWPYLRDTPAAVRFISYEPALGLLDANEGMPTQKQDARKQGLLDWVICGGESGPGARPMQPDWARSLRDQCQAASVPFFFKQWGEWEPVCDYYEEDDEKRERALDRPHRLITQQGSEWFVGVYGERHDGQPPPGTWIMHKVGKKAAGRILDGRTWDEMPL